MRTFQPVSPDCENTPVESQLYAEKTPAGPATAGSEPLIAAPGTWTAPPTDYGSLSNRVHINTLVWLSTILDKCIYKASLIQMYFLFTNRPNPWFNPSCYWLKNFHDYSSHLWLLVTNFGSAFVFLTLMEQSFKLLAKLCSVCVTWIYSIIPEYISIQFRYKVST